MLPVLINSMGPWPCSQLAKTLAPRCPHPAGMHWRRASRTLVMADGAKQRAGGDGTDNRIKALSYNILAQKYTQGG